jgi:TatD DNase family protein
MFIDTHAHIYSEEFLDDLSAMLQRATEAGVDTIYMPNIDSSSVAPMLAVAATYAHCLPMMGLHPCYVKESWKEELKEVEKHLADGRFYAVGEIGIDLYWDTTFADEQKAVFSAQLAMAREAGLPVAIHSREALDLTIGEVERMQDGRLKGVFHCFNGSEEQARKAMAQGFYLGVGGVITYKNAGMGPVFAAVGADALVLETDAPYLSPVPYRGKRNECAWIAVIGAKLAEVLEMSVEDVGKITSENAVHLFG